MAAGLTRFRSFEDARRALMEEEIARSAWGKRHLETAACGASGSEKQDTYTPGLYRFASWQEARDFDLQCMIRRKKGFPAKGPKG